MNQAQNQQTLTDPVTIASTMRPLLAKHATQCEAEAKIHPEVFAELKRTGLFKMMFPKRAGGVGLPLISHTKTVAEMAKACPGTAWAFGLLSSVSASVASMPEQISASVFSQGDELLCSVAAQTGTATRTEKGYIVSGKWGYASGCLHADYALNGIRVVDTDGNTEDVGFAIIPLRKTTGVTIKNTWQVAGVCGSGSNTVIVDNLELPQSRVIQFGKLAADQSPAANREAMEPRDHWPMEPLFPLVVLAPMLGAAEGIRELIQTTMDKRPVVAWNYQSQADSQVFVQQFGEASMEIDSAWMHVKRAAAMLDDIAPARLLTGFEKARIQADCGYAMKQLRSAGDRLMNISGPGGFANVNPLQRLWRDLNVGSRHNYLNSQLSLELYGRALLQQPSNMTQLPDISYR
ncbi:hypothetical protein HBA55_31045 [Pseudomaricurvus alkylphenolicus]|uniref:acyl-CoA dehydrogenase family protein n=1 Tax=Pseudomaricurvus alkylphenolicus TaxID=1306991 RepID=UPI00141EF61D|nr:acyl-CoA dehydrogenase family protein [Pseudomaricurvus alkylphenolicus]NIB44078.1 hypothetical protein [Pseudomaricurvus alkylphenolicus]